MVNIDPDFLGDESIVARKEQTWSPLPMFISHFFLIAKQGNGKRLADALQADDF